MTILFVLGLVILQPSRFEIETKRSISSSEVYAQVSEKWNLGDDWSIKFDMFIPWSNESWEIVYEIGQWDTLSEIARRFWTTTKILIDSNNIQDANNLSKWQKIRITNEWGEIIYEIQEKSDITTFAEKHDLDLEEVIELNYLPDTKFELVAGQQLFLNLTREQAELKWLRQTPEYVRPEWLVEDISDEMLAKQKQEEWSGSILGTFFAGVSWDNLITDITKEDEIEQPLTEIEKLIDLWEPQQQVISAEETTNQLEEQQRALEEAIEKAKNEQERKKLEEEKKKLEILIRKDIEQQQKEKEVAQQQVISATETTERIDEANEPKPEPVEKEVEQEVITAEQTTKKIEQITSCGEGKCLHKGKCWSMPGNAYCTPDDDQNAWKCEEWYVDTRRSCVEEKVYEEKTSTRWTEPVKSWTISQWYFNPYNDGYWNWWGAWHCTHYSWRYRWKHYWIMTDWRWNWGQRYWNASAAWWQVWSVPEVWSIFVADSWSWRWSAYGHVWIVIKVDWASNSILVEDMNYAGRYIVTQRWMSMNESGLIWYVYPRKK